MENISISLIMKVDIVCFDTRRLQYCDNTQYQYEYTNSTEFD